MRGLSKESMRIKQIAKVKCQMPRDTNMIKDVFKQKGIESMVINGQRWVLCTDDVLMKLIGKKEEE